MTRPLLGLLLWIMFSTVGWALDFRHYHSQDEINKYMARLQAEHPGLVRFKLLGYSQHGREVNYLVISKNDPETVPAIYLNGTHHGDEKSSTETVLGLADFLVNNQRLRDVSEFLENYAVYLQPLVNPDGHAANSRYDDMGRDPNRDYAYPERSEEDSFKSPTSRLVKELTDKVRFRAALAFHSGMEGVLWAWAYTPHQAPDHDAYLTLAKVTALAMGMPRFMQSHGDYPSRGEFIDYVYMAHGTLAMTVEVSNDPTPPIRILGAVVRRAIAGAMAFMLSVQALDHGVLKLERTGERPLLTLQRENPSPRAE